MRKKNYFLLALASMAFTACVNDDMINADHEVVDNETAWISLGVRKPTTRALNNPNEHNGTADEALINSVKILFFNGHTDGSILTNEVDFATAAVPEVTTAPKAFKVSKSAKALLVVVNPANLPALTVGTTTYSAVNAVVTPTNGVADVVGGASLNSFMMTNAKGGLEPSVSGTGAPQNLTLYPDATTAQNNTLTLFVDRVVAKVRVQAAKTSDVATIGDVFWALNVKNKKYFPVSKRTKTFFNNSTPHDIYGLGSYRIDPNYDHSSLSWGSGTPAGYGTEYTYYTETNPPASWLVANITIDGSDPDDNAPKVEYCLENTQAELGNVHAYTTHALLKTTFIPKAYQLPDLSTTDVQEADNDWIAIKGGFYTYATLMEWIEAEMKNKYYNADPDAYNTEVTDYFNDYIAAALGNTKKVELPTKVQFDGSGKTYLEQAEDLKTKFEGLEADIKLKGAFSDGTVNYYSGAESYYKIMVKHDDSDAENNKLGEFGVVRNSVYDIIVSKFNNPGYPTIPDPDPNTLDESESFLSLEIVVNPWTWYRQVEEL